MKVGVFIGLMGLFLFGCRKQVPTQNPIDRVVQEDSTNEYWNSGLHRVVQLPETTSITNIAAEALRLSETNITILEVRDVNIPATNSWDKLSPEMRSKPFDIIPVEKYKAVLVNTDTGQKVIIVQYLSKEHGSPGMWWWQIYDASGNPADD